MIGFEFGSRAPLVLRHEVVVPEGGAADGGQPWRLLYASDLHLTARRAHLVARLEQAAAAAEPHVVLLGGDLLDGTSGLAVLREVVTRLSSIAPVLAVAGNHDAWVGIDGVRSVIVAAGGRWLERSVVLPAQAGRLALQLCSEDGVECAGPSAGGVAGSRSGCRRVLVGHHPTTAERRSRLSSDARFDVALAGHLHGGQCVLWQRGTRFYPGAWFSRWTGSRFDLPHTTLVVSRGVADTLPIRFRCPREVLLVELH